MPEEEMTDFQFLTTGKYGGVGALIRKKGDGVVVAQPYKGFPATDRAGLQIGDRFVEIAGKDARGMTTEQVSALLKGTPNTNVTIKVEKLLTGQVEEVKLRRERIAHFGLGYAGSSWPTASGISSIATFYGGGATGYARRIGGVAEAGAQSARARLPQQRRRHLAGGREDRLDVRAQGHRGGDDQGAHRAYGLPYAARPRRADAADRGAS